MKILITGTAGFIGYHLTKRLADDNHEIICIDNINDYYDVDLKYGRLGALGFAPSILKEINPDELVNSSLYSNICFIKMDFCDSERLNKLFANEHFEIVFHIAAQAGVRFSIVNPNAYISSNIQGFLNILEASRSHPPSHLLYASSSSVYGLNTKMPFSELDTVNRPASIYAVTKQTNELMAYTYSHLFKIPTSGLRFFTVYGPWGRPDMAPFIFTKSIIEEKPITVYNNGNMSRDFTYIDDIIECITRLINKTPFSEEGIPSMIYNIGNGASIPLMDFIQTIEVILDKKAILNSEPMQDGDVLSTWADCSLIERCTGFKPYTPISIGMEKFIDWYKCFYHAGN